MEVKVKKLNRYRLEQPLILMHVARTFVPSRPPFPTIHVPIDDVGSLTTALGELPSYAKYARVCDDSNADGRCSAGEPLLNSWFRSRAGSGNGGVRITVKLIEKMTTTRQEIRSVMSG